MLEKNMLEKVRLEGDGAGEAGGGAGSGDFKIMGRQHSHREKMSEQRPAGGEERTIQKPGRRAF